MVKKAFLTRLRYIDNLVQFFDKIEIHKAWKCSKSATLQSFTGSILTSTQAGNTGIINYIVLC